MLKVKIYNNDFVHECESYNKVIPFAPGTSFVEESDPDKADVIFLGQIGDQCVDLELPDEFEKYKEKCWVDIEGDWLNRRIPEKYYGCNIIVNGAYKGIEKNFNRVLVRPTFSRLLYAAKDDYTTFDFPKFKRFGFIGLPDPFGVRQRIGQLVQYFPNDFRLTQKFNAPAAVGSQEHDQFKNTILNSSFSLCPRGAGHDSVRFYETCWLTRFPVVIGDNYLLGELDGIDVSFAYRISQYESSTAILAHFERLMEMSMDEIKERCWAARQYFDKHVREYFKNPNSFIERVINGISI